MVMHGFSRGVKDVEGDPATAGSGVPRALPDISGSFGPAGGDAARRVAGIKQEMKSNLTELCPLVSTRWPLGTPLCSNNGIFTRYV